MTRKGRHYLEICDCMKHQSKIKPHKMPAWRGEVVMDPPLAELRLHWQFMAAGRRTASFLQVGSP